MKLKTSSLIWTFLWCLFMGVTAISIGFGALFPSMNLISKPFVCPGGEMSMDEQVYNPYPGKTVTTLTWYCIDSQSGEKKELGIFPMSLYAGLIYGFGLFIVVFIGMWVSARRSAGYGASGLAALQRQEHESIRDAQYSSHKNFDEIPVRTKNAESATARMKELKDLRAANMISESEYEEKRAEILKGL
jgi:hypothetical protein